MVIVFKIIAGTIIGTSVMTLFSYIMSYVMDKQFKEPLLLNILLQRSQFLKETTVPPISGWIIHYGMGSIFVTIYHFIWSLPPFEPTYSSGSLLGFISSFVGIATWSFVFNIHSNPPSIDFKAHYLQLIISHVLFGLGATLGYLMI